MGKERFSTYKNTSNQTSSDKRIIRRDVFSDFIKKVDVDKLNAMLVASGETPEEMLSTGLSNTQNATIAPSHKKPSRCLRLRKRRPSYWIVFILEFLLLLLALNLIYTNVTVNDNHPIEYISKEYEDEVFWIKGQLKINDVTVNVPSDGSEHYDIAYAWTDGDKDYPTLPISVTATYMDGNDAPKYDISLYRQETVNAADIPSNKNPDNWFDDWISDADESIVQESINTGKIHGFYIGPKIGQKSAKKHASSYQNFSYYFTIGEKDDLSIYVLEGICYDNDSIENFQGIFNQSVKSIKIDKSENNNITKEPSESQPANHTT